MYSLPGALTVLFAAVKLFGFIAWSWWWVFSPVLISAGLGLAFLAVLLVIGFAANLR